MRSQGRILSDLLSERDLAGSSLLELGSGTGVGGLSAAAAGASSVVLTDGSAAVDELLRENIDANGFGDRVSTRRLRWGNDDEVTSAAALGPFDMIVGSDLLYAPESFPELLETLRALCTPGRTEVLLTYPTRHTEGIFEGMACDEGFEPMGWAEEVEPSLWVSRFTLPEGA